MGNATPEEHAEPSFEAAFGVYADAVGQLDDAVAGLMRATRRHALDQVGADSVLDDLILLDALGRLER